MRADGGAGIALRFDSAREAAIELYDRSEFGQAEGFLTTALQSDPSDKELVWRMAAVQLWKLDIKAAYETAHYALALDSRCHQACAVIMSCHIGFGEYDAAEAFADKALEISPNTPACMWTKAMCELIRGDYKNGFDRWKWGRTTKARWTRFPDKEWDGKKVGTLFVWCEQGHGDVFQFSRFITELKQFADKVVVEVYQSQLLLFQSQGWECRFVAQPKDGSCAYNFDAHVSMLDLPKYLGVEKPEDVSYAPYLKPSDKMNLDKSPGNKVGICWKGSETHMNDPQRSIKDEDLGPLLEFPLMSLQRKCECPEGWADAGNVLNDYTQTAAVLASLDLLITVDTSVAHLAGAMGVPTWCIVPTNGEWRWGMEGDCAWYPGMRIVRGTDMKETVKQIARELKSPVALEA